MDLQEKRAWLYVQHHMALMYVTPEEFDRDVDGGAFEKDSAWCSDYLKREAVGKWLTYRDAKSTSCKGIDYYFTIDLSD